VALGPTREDSFDSICLELMLEQCSTAAAVIPCFDVKLATMKQVLEDLCKQGLVSDTMKQETSSLAMCGTTVSGDAFLLCICKPAFTLANISQSFALYCKENMISVTITANAPMCAKHCQSVITIKNLNGALVNNGANQLHVSTFTANSGHESDKDIFPSSPKGTPGYGTWMDRSLTLFSKSAVATMAVLSVVICGTCLSILTLGYGKDGSGCRPIENNEDKPNSVHGNLDGKKKKKYVQFRCRRQAGSEHARLQALEDLTRTWNSELPEFEHALDVMTRIIECKHISSAEFDRSPLVLEIQSALQKRDHGTRMGRTTRFNVSLILSRVGELLDVVSANIVRSPSFRGQPSGGATEVKFPSHLSLTCCVDKNLNLKKMSTSKNSLGQQTQSSAPRLVRILPEDIPGGSSA